MFELLLHISLYSGNTQRDIQHRTFAKTIVSGQYSQQLQLWNLADVAFRRGAH